MKMIVLEKPNGYNNGIYCSLFGSVAVPLESLHIYYKLRNTAISDYVHIDKILR